MESRLAITRDGLEARLRFEFGYTPTLGEDDRVDGIVQRAWESGLRQWYTPPLVDGVSHNWTFLKPVGTVVVPAGERTALLPEDFGGFEGELFVLDATTVRPPLQEVGTLLGLYSRYPTTTGAPQFVEPIPDKDASASGGQRVRVWVWPEPDQDYTLRFRYYFHPDTLTGARPYALGGPQHAETVIAACLAAAELIVDGERGRWADYFAERLAASVSVDRRMRPQRLGYNADASPDSRRGERWWLEQGYTVSVASVTPD